MADKKGYSYISTLNKTPELLKEYEGKYIYDTGTGKRYQVSGGQVTEFDVEAANQQWLKDNNLRWGQYGSGQFMQGVAANEYQIGESGLDWDRKLGDTAKLGFRYINQATPEYQAALTNNFGLGPTRTPEEIAKNAAVLSTMKAEQAGQPVVAATNNQANPYADSQAAYTARTGQTVPGYGTTIPAVDYGRKLKLTDDQYTGKTMGATSGGVTLYELKDGTATATPPPAGVAIGGVKTGYENISTAGQGTVQAAAVDYGRKLGPTEFTGLAREWGTAGITPAEIEKYYLNRDDNGNIYLKSGALPSANDIIGQRPGTKTGTIDMGGGATASATVVPKSDLSNIQYDVTNDSGLYERAGVTSPFDQYLADVTAKMTEVEKTAGVQDKLTQLTQLQTEAAQMKTAIENESIFDMREIEQASGALAPMSTIRLRQANISKEQQFQMMIAQNEYNGKLQEIAIAQGAYDKAEQLAKDSADLYKEVKMAELEYNLDLTAEQKAKAADALEYQRDLALDGYVYISDPKELSKLTEDQIFRDPVSGRIYKRPVEKVSGGRGNGTKEFSFSSDAKNKLIDVNFSTPNINNIQQNIRDGFSIDEIINSITDITPEAEKALRESFTGKQPEQLDETTISIILQGALDEDGNLDISKIPADQRIEVIQRAKELGYFDEEDEETKSWLATQWQDVKDFINPFNK